jgi:hypothetical protein
MMGSDSRWRDDFPLQDDVEDFAGKTRIFAITCHEGPLGFTVRAEEQGTKGIGYEFGAYSETSPYAALGRIREKMSRALAMRHIGGSSGNYHMLHNELRGRITSDAQRGVLLVVDGRPLDMDEVTRILETHEGFEFELRIRSGLE